MKDLDYITDSPPNAAVPLSELDGRPLPQDQVYLRNSFPTPGPNEVTEEIEVVLPGQPSRTLTPEDLGRLAPVTMNIVLECAGNGRSFMRPVVTGLAWGLGGASPIRIGGVRLIDALGAVPEEVVEVVLTGFDRGTVSPEGEVPYQFSVPADLVRDGSALLVTHVGGELLGHEHGGPVRFMLPGHYAMKSVKWLTRIEGVTTPFTGHFVNRYRYFGDHTFEDGSPVAEIQVRSVIARPIDGERLPAGPVTVAGSAWTGTGTIVAVELSADHGRTWLDADLGRASGRAAVDWYLELALGSGRHTVMARARDSEGNVQPLEPRWNRGGYANNLIHRVGFDMA
ncbi:MAG: molybdopterin-dependent oxidoreductase [Acidimicrobiia bacterium]